MQKQIQKSLALALLVLAVCGAPALSRPSTAHADPPPPTRAEATTRADAAQRAACPTDIPGTAIVATPVNDGAELLFFAPRNQAEMRRRVRALSNRPTEDAAVPEGPNAPTAAEIVARQPRASVRNVRGGAVLKLVARNLDQLADVQAHALEYAQSLAGDQCPLLGDSPVLPNDAKKAAAPASVQVPAGIVPGVGGVSSGPLTSVPGLGF